VIVTTSPPGVCKGNLSGVWY